MLEASRLPLPLRLGDRLHTWLWARGRPTLRLDAEAVLDAARTRTGLDDFGAAADPEGHAVLMEGLTRGCTALEADADLTLVGRLLMHMSLVDGMANRLRLYAWQKAHPVAEYPLTPPVVLVGLPRSGTTWSHRLLAASTQLRIILPWQLERPVQPRTLDRWTGALKVTTLRTLMPSLDVKHRLDNTQAEEEFSILDGTGSSIGFAMLFPETDYTDWYFAQDQRAPYRYWAEVLRAMESHAPGQRFLLKTPGHTPWMGAIVDAVPDATLIQLHRDPVQTVSSIASLMHTLRAPLTRHRDPHRLGQMALEIMANLADGGAAFRTAQPEARVLHVPYTALVADPVGTVARMHAHIGLPFDPAARVRVETLVRNRPQRKYGHHPHSLADVGLTEAEVRARFADHDAFRTELEARWAEET